MTGETSDDEGTIFIQTPTLPADLLTPELFR
jgi:hypothetical protein